MIQEVTDPEIFARIAGIYERAFPASETRPVADTLDMLRADKDYRLFVCGSGSVDGFMLAYSFPEFTFLDYMAVASGMRRRGIGGLMVEYLKEQALPAPIILEVQRPTDQASRDRVRFYERHGAATVLDGYVLPSYGGAENEAMLLMSTGRDCSVPGGLASAIRAIYGRVYGYGGDRLVSQSLASASW